MDKQLADLVGFPLLQTHPTVQAEMMKRTEFFKLRTDPNEPLPKRGNLMKHQEVIARFMIENTRTFNTSKPGTGKTCSVIGAVERLRILRKEGKIQGYISRCIILCPEPLKKEITYQLYCVCTQPQYVESGDIKDFYSVYSYGEFVNELISEYERTLSAGAIQIDSFAKFVKRQYSNVFFYCDEIQVMANVNIPESLFINMTSIDQLVFNIISESKTLTTDVKNIQRVTRNVARFDHRYIIMWLLFHLAENTKIMLGTATTSINDPADIVPQLNLILDADKQMTLSVYQSKTVEELAQMFAGYFFYIRMPDNGVFFIMPGIPLNYKYTKYQDGVLKQIISQNKAILGIMPNTGPQYANFMSLKRQGSDDNMSNSQASLFFFPSYYSLGVPAPPGIPEQLYYNGGAGVGVGEYYYEVNNSQAKIIFPQYAQFLSNIANYVNHGILYLYLMEICWGQNNHYYLKPQIGEGIDVSTSNDKVFVYCEDKKGGGCYNIGLALENCRSYNPIFMKDMPSHNYHTFQRYIPLSEHFIGEIKKTKGCSASGSFRSINTSILEPRPRYAIIDGDMSDSQKYAILELANHPDNYGGRYLKVVIGTRVMQAGINLMEFTTEVMMGYPWNESNATQAKYRVFRTNSHTITMRKLAEEGKPQKFGILLFNLLAITERDYQRNLDTNNPVDGDDIQTIKREIDSYDLRTIVVSEKKDINNSKTNRAIKMAAIDCHLHRARNIRDTDVDGDAAADYDTKDYKCINSVNPEDYGTNNEIYDLEYIDDEIILIVRDLFSLFKETLSQRKEGYFTRNRLLSLRLNDVYEIFKEKYREDIIKAALAYAIKERVIFKDALGRNSRFIIEGDRLVQTTDEEVRNVLPLVHPGLSLDHYSNDMIAISNRTLADISDSYTEGGKLSFEDAAVKYYYKGDRSEEVVNIIRENAIFHCAILVNRVDQLQKIIIKKYNNLNTDITNVDQVPTGNKSQGAPLGSYTSITSKETYINSYELLMYKLGHIFILLESLEKKYDNLDTQFYQWISIRWVRSIAYFLFQVIQTSKASELSSFTNNASLNPRLYDIATRVNNYLVSITPDTHKQNVWNQCLVYTKALFDNLAYRSLSGDKMCIFNIIIREFLTDSIPSDSSYPIEVFNEWFYNDFVSLPNPFEWVRSIVYSLFRTIQASRGPELSTFTNDATLNPKLNEVATYVNNHFLSMAPEAQKQNVWNQCLMFTKALFDNLAQQGATNVREFLAKTIRSDSNYPIGVSDEQFYNYVVSLLPTPFNYLHARTPVYTYELFNDPPGPYQEGSRPIVVSPNDVYIFHILKNIDKETGYAKYNIIYESGGESKAHLTRFYNQAKIGGPGWDVFPNDYILEMPSTTTKVRVKPMVLNDVFYIYIERIQRIFKKRAIFIFADKGQDFIPFYGIYFSKMTRDPDLSIVGINLKATNKKSQFKGQSIKTIGSGANKSLYNSIKLVLQEMGVLNVYQGGNIKVSDSFNYLMTFLARNGLLIEA